MVMAGSPAHREADVVLRDGSTVRVRPAGPEDARAVERLLSGLSDRSRWLRYFSGAPNIDKAVQWATELDDDRRYGLVATSGDGRVIGHIGFEREPDRPERAEVAMEVADACRTRGWARSCSARSPRRPARSGSRSSAPRCCPRTTR